jgi:acetyl esterase
VYALTLEQARAAEQAAVDAMAGAEREPVFEVIDRRIPGPGGDLPIRIYRPSAERGLGVLVYFHGGGWFLGSIELCDEICRGLANAAGCVVVAVEYRLAPEAKFPAAVEDCFAATRWLAGNPAEVVADASRLVVGGDSAGGNLAAAVTLLARDRGDVELVGQLLVCPNTDLRAATPSMRENTDPWLLNGAAVAKSREYYLATPEDAVNPLASPLRAEDLRGLPPALVITAECDPLRDEGERYARRLTSAGVTVESARYDGMAHGFFSMPDRFPAGAAARAHAAQRLRDWLADRSTVARG